MTGVARTYVAHLRAVPELQVSRVFLAVESGASNSVECSAVTELPVKKCCAYLIQLAARGVLQRTGKHRYYQQKPARGNVETVRGRGNIEYSIVTDGEAAGGIAASSEGRRRPSSK